MNSVEYRFKKVGGKKPHLAAYPRFVEAIEGRKYNRKTIRKNFLNLVPEEDYDEDVLKDLISDLVKLSNAPMNVQNEGKKDLLDPH